MARFCNNNIGATAALLLSLFILAESLSTAAPTHSTNSGRKCGGAAECTVSAAGGDGGEEFLMDSQTATWLLSSLQDNTQKISYKGLQRPPVCDAKRSGSCLADKVNGGNNKCDFHNRSCVR
ncbi:PREDICTED: uncharacterized protein LOC109180232 [Ipomoea nil]|uniref:uncharacterized protein LOC109180232 n=1 Tax=Ipomoea nil TaxID=35883 RepID=UPI000901EFFD|nr:PREDICTED: uncharacterized protein LOC109180232 [Ipomoea nil]